MKKQNNQHYKNVELAIEYLEKSIGHIAFVRMDAITDLKVRKIADEISMTGKQMQSKLNEMLKNV